MLLNFLLSLLKSSQPFAPFRFSLSYRISFRTSSLPSKKLGSRWTSAVRLASGMSPWNEIIIVFPSRGFISGSLSLFRASRTNSLFSSRRVVVPSKFHVSCIVPPSFLPSRYRGRRIYDLEISGAEIELETRVNEHYTAKTTGIDQMWAWSKRKVAIENKLGGVGALLFYSVG